MSASRPGEASADDDVGRVRAELAIAQGRFLQVCRIEGVAYWEWDAAAGSVWIAGQMAELFGVKPGDRVSFERLLERVHPEDSERVRHAVQSALDADGPRQMEIRLVRPDGEVRRIRMRFEPQRAAEGCGLRLVGTSMDVSDLLDLRQALHSSKSECQTMLENIPVAVALLGGDHRLETVNPAFEALTGYSAAELRALTPLDITHPDDLERARYVLRDLAESRESKVVMEKRYVRKDGTIFWGRLRAVTRERDGARVRVAVIEDITGERERERARLASNREQRDALVREIHHRVKNVIQGVTGLLEREASERPELRPLIENALTRVASLAVVHGLQSAAAHREVVLCNLVRGILRLSEPLFPGAVELDIPAEFVPVEIAPEETVPVALILNEMVSNAVKHARKGGDSRRIAVSIRRRGPAVIVEVRNEPASLPPDFDFAAGVGTSTGLKLVRSLLPLEGAKLAIEDVAPGAVVASLELKAPVLRRGPAIGG
jgi:PAS domain S-box-containing protein